TATGGPPPRGPPPTPPASPRRSACAPGGAGLLCRGPTPRTGDRDHGTDAEDAVADAVRPGRGEGRLAAAPGLPTPPPGSPGGPTCPLRAGRDPVVPHVTTPT